MFQHITHPTRRTLLDHSMGAVLALAIAFAIVSIWAFALAARVPEARALTAPGSTIECKTQDGTVVLVGEIVSMAPRR